MSQHPEEMSKIMGQLDDSTVNLGSGEPFDAGSLQETLKYIETIRPSSFWVVQMEDMGPVDANGYPVEKDASGQDALQMSMIYVYDDKGCYRANLEVIGDVKPDQLIKCVVHPLVSCRPRDAF